jgi:hypothetical protein
MPSRNVTYLQVVKGKRQMKLACGEVKYRERKTEKQYQLTGIRDGRGDIRIGALRHLKILAVQWKIEGVTDIQLAERTDDEFGLHLERVYV